MIRLFCISVLLWTTVAYPYFQDKLPNGDQVPHPCKVNYIWHGVGHLNSFGGGTRNQFGLDFKAADLTWTKDLCRKDSDGDGRTNGEELGDPGCTWTQGTLPSRMTNITHPGICTQADDTICNKDKDWVDCNVSDGLENCDVIKEPETKNITVRFPETPVPKEETSYVCMAFNLPNDQDYHLVAHEPYIENQDVMHHILIYGCDPNEDPVPDDKLNIVKKCGMGGNRNCQTLIGLWAVGMTGNCLNGPYGLRFGASGYKQAVLEFHWNNPNNVENFKDSSGVTFFYTPKLRPNDAAVMMTGQLYLEIPPGQTSYSAVGKCDSSCTRMLIKGPINIFWAMNHMHYLGHEMKMEVYRDGTFYTELTNDPVYNYDSPTEKTYTTAVEVLPGDEIVTTCKFKSTSRPKTTYFGQATSDEMCVGFLSFYPASNMPFATCTAWKGIPVCNQWLTRNHNGCEWMNFVNLATNDSRVLFNKVMDNCRPFQGCTIECKNELKVLFAEHPCMKGDVHDLIRQMALEWKKPEVIGFIAGIDSCKLELASELEPENGNTNDASCRRAFYSWLMLSILAAFKVLV